MDLMIELFAVLAIFSAVHERALEVLRLPLPSLQKARWKGWQHMAGALELVTSGPLNVLPAISLALVTRANLLTLVKASGAQAAGADAFFTQYLSSTPLRGEVILGCVLMGLATTLGSQLWHDAAKALIDLRGGLNALPGNVRKLVAARPDVAAPAPKGEGNARPTQATLEIISLLVQRTAAQFQRAEPGESPLAAQLKGEFASSLVKAAQMLETESKPEGTRAP